MKDAMFLLRDSEKEAIVELKESLRRLYGPRLKQTLLFGSKARGESTPESDIDVLVVLENLQRPRQARREILHITNPIDLKHGVFLSVYTVDAEYFDKANNVPFYSSVRAEAVPL